MADYFQQVGVGISNYADFDARGVGMTAEENGVSYKMIEVPTPAWFPDSFLRSLKRNLYFNMINNGSYYGYESIDDSNSGKCLDFYKENSSGGIVGNLINTAVKSVVSTAANQVMSITSKVDSVINGVSSLFGGNEGNNKDLYAMISETARNPFLASQPYLKINGIHVAENVRDTYKTISDALKGLGNAWSAIGKKNDMESVLDSWNTNIVNALKSMQILPKDASGGNLYQILATTLVQPEYRMHNFSEAQLLAGISGFYTLTCKLPFFGNNAPILKSSGASAFKVGWGLNGATEDSNALISLARNIGFGGTVWNNPIEWSPDKVGDDGFAPLNYSFNIYNDTLEHMLTNLAFIWSFGATTQAVTDYVMFRPPYLYDIEIPGGVRYKYCTCGFQVTAQGKLRRVTSLQQCGTNANGDTLCSLFKSICGIDINPNAISHVPDYYKVDLVFRPLLPNMWNFIDSFLHDGNTVPSTGKELRHMLAKLVANFNASGG
jgi:hypothetical protein